MKPSRSKQPCPGADDAGGARGGVGPGVGGMTSAPTPAPAPALQGHELSTSQLAVALALAPSSSDLTTAKSVLSNAPRNLLAGRLELDSSTDDLVANFESALSAARRITSGPAPVSCAGAGTHKSRAARNYALQILALLRLSLQDLDHTLNDTVLR
jgi:hypothetical protein